MRRIGQGGALWMKEESNGLLAHTSFPVYRILRDRVTEKKGICSK